jgi:hypothetical protein
VVFDEDSFPLVASPSLTDLDFLCDSGPTVFTIGTHLTTADTSTPAPHRPAPEIPLGFEPPMAPLPAPAVPPGFLPRAATTAAPRLTPPTAPRTVPTMPPAVTDGPPPRTWLASPVAYVRQKVGAGAVGTRGTPGAVLRREVGAGAQATRGALGAALSRKVGVGAVGIRGALGAALRREAGTGAQATCGGPGAAVSREAATTLPPPLPRPSVGGQGVVVPVMPPENPHQMITRDKSGFRVVPDRLVLTVAISSPTPSPIPSSACAALVDPHWCAAMEEEYGALISNGSWFPDLRAPTLSPASGSSRTSSVLTGPWIATRPVGSFGVSLSAPESTTMRLSARL